MGGDNGRRIKDGLLVCSLANTGRDAGPRALAPFVLEFALMSVEPIVITRRQLGACTIWEELKVSSEGDLLFRYDMVDDHDCAAEEWSTLRVAARDLGALATALGLPVSHVAAPGSLLDAINAIVARYDFRWRLGVEGPFRLALFLDRLGVPGTIEQDSVVAENAMTRSFGDGQLGREPFSRTVDGTPD